MYVCTGMYVMYVCQLELLFLRRTLHL